MRRVLLLLVICVLLIGCSNSESDANRPSYYDCPVCGERTEYEPDPDDAVEWLSAQGYTILHGIQDVQELAWEFFANDPAQLDDLLNDYGIDRLKDNGWALIPPEGTP